MSSVLGMVQVTVVCGTILSMAFVVLLAMPHSKLREFCLPIIAWCFALFCGAYCISPVDIVSEALVDPFGLVDDVGAAVAGVVAAMPAMKSQAA